MGDNILKKLEFKRMLKRYESSLEDLEYLKEMASQINSDFNSALAAKKRPDLLENKKLETMAEEDAKNKEPEKKDANPLLKKLFRKIVVLCHPDKLTDDLTILQRAKIVEQYDLAVKAYDANNWAMLIMVAIKLEVDLGDEFMEHVDKIKEDAKKIEDNISQIQNSIAWQWYHAPDNQKDDMLNMYVKHLEDLLLKPKVITKTILGLGHPRTGTRYTAKLLQQMGLKVQHERMGHDGIVAWQFASDKKPRPYIQKTLDETAYKFNIIIYNVRNPLKSIPSIIHTEETTLEYRQMVGGFTISQNPVETAILSILAWDKLITDKKPDFVYRIEDQELELYEFLQSCNLKVKAPNKLEPQNARQHAGIDAELQKHFDSVNPELKTGINKFCEKYGYPKIF